MDSLVKRIIIVERNGDQHDARVIYKKRQKKRRRVSTWSRPLERASEHLFKAQITFGEIGLNRQDKSNRRRRDGWIVDTPANLLEAGREAYNEARKAVPFKLLPRV